ncbi:hypothetical protein EV126DRAFT_426915 [Verticillium dahliae]|nr:hypothetical protein EV126DRAFT_426915 [Verticillium dahliae]
MVSIIIHASYSDERLIQEFLNELFASDVSIMVSMCGHCFISSIGLTSDGYN